VSETEAYMEGRMRVSDGLSNNKLFSKTNTLGWIYFSLAGMFFLYEFFLRTSMGALEEIFRLDLGLSAVSISLISSAYFLAYSLMQIPAGLLIDKYGVRKVGSVAIFVAALGSFIFSASSGVFLAWVGRFIIGLGSAFAFVMMCKIILDWFPRGRLGFLVGMTQVLGIIGPILAGVPLLYLLQACENDWRKVFYFIMCLGCVLAVLYWSVVRDRPNIRGCRTLKTNANKERVQDVLLRIIKIKQLWFIALFVFLLYGPIEIMGSLFGIPLMIHQGFNVKVASAAVSCIWLGLGIGSPVVGYISDLIAKRKSVLIFCALLGALATFFLIWGTYSSIIIYGFLFLVIGVAASAQTLSFTLVIENVNPDLSGAAVGFNNMFVILGAAFGQMVTGIILSLIGGGGHSYSLLNYQFALTFCVLLFIASAIVALFCIRESFSYK
jgi:MFS family permease